VRLRPIYMILGTILRHVFIQLCFCYFDAQIQFPFNGKFYTFNLSMNKNCDVALWAAHCSGDTDWCNYTSEMNFWLRKPEEFPANYTLKALPKIHAYYRSTHKIAIFVFVLWYTNECGSVWEARPTDLSHIVCIEILIFTRLLWRLINWKRKKN
jgi:hypothetical protein